MVCIYKIESPTGKIYVGQSWDMEKRFKYHKQDSKYTNTKLYNSIRKYGIDKHPFGILHELPEDVNQATLDTYEILYWGLFKESGAELLNTRYPGSKGKHSQDTITKIKATKKEKKAVPWNKGVSGYTVKSKNSNAKGRCPHCNMLIRRMDVYYLHFDNCKHKRDRNLTIY